MTLVILGQVGYLDEPCIWFYLRQVCARLNGVGIKVGSVWTTTRVLTLASDHASARVGQGLAVPGKWASLGQGSDLLWGECRGSGSKPYQTKVALADAATSCSCPSRKFPCKHALGLLLIWVDSPGLLAQIDPPSWVAAWIESRIKKAEAKGTKQTEVGIPAVASSTPAVLAAKQKREAARLGKVAAGLEDLDLWLGDLLRSGFTTLSSRPRTLWDEQARRLVDAQCPGVARRLRQIDTMSLVGDGWQTALLDRLAQIHLLIEGWRHRETLPADVLADVRTAIGFPTDFDGARAGITGTQVRDTWRVLGQTTALEDRITVRRTWLWGQDSDRSALILDFAALGRPFEVSFEPGTSVAATLGYLASAAPLRAVLIDRHAPATPFETLGGGRSIAAAQANLGAVLARCPWVEQIVVILDGLTLRFDAGAWIAIDPTGAWLPLAREFTQGWQIEAESGGMPVVLVGEFDGVTLLPIGLVVADRYLPLGPPPAASGPEPAGRWLIPTSALLIEATTAAVVGVDRKAPPAGLPSSSIGVLLAQLGDRPAPNRLLAIAAVGGLAARVGRQASGGVFTTLCPFPAADDRPACSPDSARRLRGLVVDSAGNHRPPEWLFDEWFSCCDQAGQRVPADLLVAVLDRYGHIQPPHPGVQAVLGARGRWLAGRNPRWAAYAPAAPSDEDPATWETGSKAVRLDLFRRLRATDPAEARRLVESTFSVESADTRASIVHAFEHNLTAADEPFLEAALDNRSREVRKWAAARLDALPNSRLAGRMVERMRSLLRWEGDRLIATRPDSCDEAMIRDMIAPDFHVRVGPDLLGLRNSHLHAVVARTPLAALTVHLGRSPGDLIAAAYHSGQGFYVLDAWEIAALKQGDIAWSAALARHQLRVGAAPTSPRLPQLFTALPSAERDAVIVAQLAAGAALDWIIELIAAADGPVSLEVGRMLMSQIQELVRSEMVRTADTDRSIPHRINRDLGERIAPLVRKLPFALIDEAELPPLPSADYGGVATAIAAREAFAVWVDRWTFRRDMHQEFAPR